MKNTRMLAILGCILGLVGTTFADECLGLRETDPNEYEYWVEWGRPDCWCYPRQCRGDADGLQTGPFWVAIPDLNLFRAAINKPNGALRHVPNGICADFDHAKTGPFHVAIVDLFIIRLYINKPEADVPLCDEPPIYTGPYNFWTSP